MKRLIILSLGLAVLGLSMGCLYPEREHRRQPGREAPRNRDQGERRDHDDRRDKDRDERHAQ